MEHFGSVEEILDFAIAGEMESHRFYTELATKTENPAMKKVFEDFAAEELQHKAKLEAIKLGSSEISVLGEDVPDLHIADYVVETAHSSAMTYQQALVIAMKKEKAAYRLYLDLAAVAEDEQLTNTFLWLAEQEAKHKLRFELEYDDEVLKED